MNNTTNSKQLNPLIDDQITNFETTLKTAYLHIKTQLADKTVNPLLQNAIEYNKMVLY